MPTPTVQVGRLKITGVAAFVVQLAIGAATGWLMDCCEEAKSNRESFAC